MEKYNAFGIGTNVLYHRLNEKFDVVVSDPSSQIFLQSKKVFRHEEDGLKFDYRYCIEVINLADWTGEDGKVLVNLKLVPEFGSLCVQRQADVFSSSGLENSNEVGSYDVDGYGLSVPIGSETLEITTSLDRSRKVKRLLDIAASVFESIDSLRGFYLDRPVNMIGVNGWDLLYDFINGEDYVKSALNRASEQYSA